MKKVVIISLVVLLAILAFFLPSDDSKKVCFSDSCVKVKVVDTPTERTKGLMHVENLPKDEGMWFVFDKSDVYPFWMKNTLIPLDIIWVNKDFQVVAMATAKPCVKDPCTHYNPGANALYVLETNAGWAIENNLRVGEKLHYA